MGLCLQVVVLKGKDKIKMVFGLVSRTVSRNINRKFTTTVARRSQEWQQEGVPGSNMPFSHHNKYKFTLLCMLFFGSGLSFPFIIMRRQLLIDSGYYQS